MLSGWSMRVIVTQSIFSHESVTSPGKSICVGGLAVSSLSLFSPLLPGVLRALSLFPLPSPRTASPHGQGRTKESSGEGRESTFKDKNKKDRNDLTLSRLLVARSL